VANFILGQSVGIDETNTFNTFQLTFFSSTKNSEPQFWAACGLPVGVALC